ncbi:MAG: alpha/beta fold hydrolase [Bacteroidota bacterium]|nr:alpha/beta fold hydrolase [Bacteroidota bacterium]
MELFFRKLGQGTQKLVILHGLYGSSDNWMTLGRKLSETREVYLVDLRNHGRSFHDSEHSYDAMVADLAWFLETEGLNRICLLGHSMGGKVAIKFAAEYPDKIEKLIVADIAPKNYLLLGKDASQYTFHQSIIDGMLALHPETCKSLKDVEARMTSFAPEPSLRHFLMKNIAKEKQDGYHWRINAPVLKHWLKVIIGGVDYRDLSKNAPYSAYPVLFLRGGNSSYIQDNDIPLLKSLYTNLRVELIPEAGHWLHAEQPQLFFTKVTEFLRARSYELTSF